MIEFLAFVPRKWRFIYMLFNLGFKVAIYPLLFGYNFFLRFALCNKFDFPQTCLDVDFPHSIDIIGRIFLYYARQCLTDLRPAYMPPYKARLDLLQLGENSRFQMDEVRL